MRQMSLSRTAPKLAPHLVALARSCNLRQGLCAKVGSHLDDPEFVGSAGKGNLGILARATQASALAEVAKNCKARRWQPPKVYLTHRKAALRSCADVQWY